MESLVETLPYFCCVEGLNQEVESIDLLVNKEPVWSLLSWNVTLDGDDSFLQEAGWQWWVIEMFETDKTIHGSE